MGFAKYVINDSSIIFLFSKSKVSFFIFLINIYIYICLCNTLFYSYINNACMWYWALFKYETDFSQKIVLFWVYGLEIFLFIYLFFIFLPRKMHSLRKIPVLGVSESSEPEFWHKGLWHFEPLWEEMRETHHGHHALYLFHHQWDPSNFHIYSILEGTLFVGL